MIVILILFKVLRFMHPRHASCLDSREDSRSWDWGSVSCSLRWWSAQGSHRLVWETARCGESPEVGCWASRPLQLKMANSSVMILVNVWLKSQRKQYAVNSTNVKIRELLQRTWDWDEDQRMGGSCRKILDHNQSQPHQPLLTQQRSQTAVHDHTLRGHNGGH